jgi:pimeloyl-ACP methyl ester carboxylesterase
MTDSSDDIQLEALRVLEALKPRRRARPRLAEPLREARDQAVHTPFGPVMAWRLDPWGSSGTAPATLLVHGWEDDNALWGPMIEALIEAGRPVVAFDLPGHGFSPAEDCSTNRASAAIRAVAEAMGPVDSLIAHSFGCPAATLAMSEGLRIGRAVLIATPMPSETSFERHWTRAQARLEVSDAAIARAKAIAFARDVAVPTFDYPTLAAGMTAKGLFIHSIDDEECPPENSRIIADAWPGAGLSWVDGLGHRLLVQDAATIALAAGFVEGR